MHERRLLACEWPGTQHTPCDVMFERGRLVRRRRRRATAMLLLACEWPARSPADLAPDAIARSCAKSWSPRAPSGTPPSWKRPALESMSCHECHECHGMAWHGMAWHDMAWHGRARARARACTCADGRELQKQKESMRTFMASRWPGDAPSFGAMQTIYIGFSPPIFLGPEFSQSSQNIAQNVDGILV